MFSRSEFLTAASAPLVAAASSPAPASGDASAPHRYAFDRARFESMLGKPVKHRQVIAWSKLDEGVGLHYGENALDAYETGFGEGPGTLHVAFVLYGSAIATLLPDGVWSRFSLATYLPKIGDRVAAPNGKNPFLARAIALASRGCSFFICNNALHGASQALGNSAEGHGADVDDIYAALAGAFDPLPYALIVPAGIAAVNAAQEARFTFFQVTL